MRIAFRLGIEGKPLNSLRPGFVDDHRRIVGTATATDSRNKSFPCTFERLPAERPPASSSENRRPKGITDRPGPPGFPADFSKYSSLLRLCGSAKSLCDGMLAHENIIRNGLEHNRALENLLLQMYTNCGASKDAHALFCKLRQKDASSWNFLIRAYSVNNESSALRCFERMHEEGTVPDKFVFIGILSACNCELLLMEGRRIHSRIHGTGLESDVLVATALLHMYGKCGNISDARMLFDSTCDRDTVVWNAMIAAHVNAGQGKDSMQLFTEMQRSGVLPTKATFLSVLEACASLAALAEGMRVHECIMASNLQSDIAIGNALINMYSKCGSLEDAQRFFDQMQELNSISWNTMIAAYTMVGQGNNALVLFDKMQQKRFRMDKFTFVSVLVACAAQAAIAVGKQLHSHIDHSVFRSDVDVCAALVNMYGKCGCLDDARKVFDKVSKPDIFTWNAIIAAYSQHGLCSDAIELFDVMQSKHVMPNKATFMSILDACASHKKLIEGMQIHDRIRCIGFEVDVIIGTALVNMYGKCCCLKVAEEIFHNMLAKDTILCNTMVALYTQQGESSGTLMLFNQILEEGVIPNKVTYSSLLNACASQSDLGVGKQMHARIALYSYEFDTVVGTALVNMYGKCNSLEAAQQIFQKLDVRDLVAWTTMISVSAQCEHGKECVQLFDQMLAEALIPDTVTFIGILSACASQEALPVGKQMHTRVVNVGFDSDIVLGNALVNMYGKCGCLEVAHNSFEKMPKWDKVTFVNMLSACASHAALNGGLQMHLLIVFSGLELDIVLGNALINMYGKCSGLGEAQKLFDQMTQRDMVSWNSMMAAYSQNGNGKDILNLFDKMQQDGVMPDVATYVSILCACSHAGLVNEGCRYFYTMIHDHGIIPILDHYNCLVDLLARAGQLDVAEYLLNVMPLRPTAVSWTTLLGACKTEVDIMRGQRAGKHVLKLAPEDASPHVLLSNIYSAAARVNTAMI